MVRFEKFKNWHAAENVLWRDIVPAGGTSGYLGRNRDIWAEIGTVPPKSGHLTCLPWKPDRFFLMKVGRVIFVCKKRPKGVKLVSHRWSNLHLAYTHVHLYQTEGTLLHTLRYTYT